MSAIVSVDVGGTRIRAAAYLQDGAAPVSQRQVETRADEPGAFDRLAAAVEAVWPRSEAVDAIGICSPGPLDPHTGVIMTTPNIKEWRDFPLTGSLTGRFGVPAFLGNDADLAGLAEWKFGAGRGHHNLLYLTVSTGVGSGVINEDRLLQGEHGLAAELGHTIVQADGALCGCGGRGHLESYSSGTGIERHVAEQLAAGRASSLDPSRRHSAREIAEAARQGDALALEAFAQAGKYLGIGVANFLHAFNPSILIFGGGVSRSGALLFEPFMTSLSASLIHPRYLQDLVITSAELGEEAGLLGARALVEMKLDR